MVKSSGSELPRLGSNFDFTNQSKFLTLSEFQSFSDKWSVII